MDPQYPAGAIVWVKLEGGRWWPGEVASESDCSDVLENLRKPPLAVVKFFEEDCFHIVKSDQAIHPYECAKKEEFLKRGKDFKMSGKDAFNLQSKFDSDVAKAEAICRPAKKFVISKNVHLPSSPRLGNRSYIKAPSAERFDYNTVGEERRPFGLFWGRYEEPGTPRIRQQPTTPKVKDSEYTCDTCGYKTARLENIVRHHKSHSDPYSFHPGKETEPMFVFEKAHPLKYRKKSHKDQARHSTGSIHIHKSRSPQKKVDKGRIAFIPTPKKRKLPPDVSNSAKDSMSTKKKSKASQVVLSQVTVKKPFINPFEEEEETDAPAPPALKTTEVPSETKSEVKETEEVSLDLSTDLSHEDLNDKDNMELEERKPVVSTVAWEEFIKDSPTKIHDVGVSRSVTRHLSESDSDNEPMPHELGTGPTNGHVVPDPLHASVNFVPLPVAEPVHVPVSHVSLSASECVSNVSLPTTEVGRIPVGHVSLPPAESACVPVSHVSLPSAESLRVPVSHVSLPPAESARVSVNQVSLPTTESVSVPVTRVSLPPSESACVSTNKASLPPTGSERVTESKAPLPAAKSEHMSASKASLPAAECEHVSTSKASLPVVECESVFASKISLPSAEPERMFASKVSVPSAQSEPFRVSHVSSPSTEAIRGSGSPVALPDAESGHVPVSRVSLPADESVCGSGSHVSMPATESVRGSASHVSLLDAKSARVPVSQVSVPVADSVRVSVSQVSLPAAEPVRSSVSHVSLPAAPPAKVPVSRVSFSISDPRKAFKSRITLLTREPASTPVRHSPLTSPDPLQIPVSEIPLPPTEPLHVPVSEIPLPPSDPIHAPVSSIPLPEANVVTTALAQECTSTHKNSYSDSVEPSLHKKKNIDSRAIRRDLQDLISVPSVKSTLPKSSEMTLDGCQKKYLPTENEPVEQMDCEEITELPVAGAQIPSVTSFQLQRVRPFYDDVGSRQQLTTSVEEVHVSQPDDTVEVVALDDMTMHIDQETLRDTSHTHLHHLTIPEAHDDVVVENTDMVHGDIVVADGSLHAGDIMVGEEIEVQEIEIGEEVLQTEEIVLSDGVMHHVEIPLESDVHIGETSYMENNHGMSVDGRLNMNSGLVLQCVGTPYSSVDTTDRGCTVSQFALKDRGPHYLASAKEAVNKTEYGDTISASEQLRLDECSIVNPAELSSSGSGLIASGMQRKFDTVTTTTLDSRSSTPTDVDSDSDLPPAFAVQDKKCYRYQVDDIIWVKYRKLFWPAVVCKVYEKEKKLTVMYVDAPEQCSRTRISVNRVKPFYSFKICQLQAEIPSTQASSWNSAVDLVDEYLCKRAMYGRIISPVKYFHCPYTYAYMSSENLKRDKSKDSNNYTDSTLVPQNNSTNNHMAETKDGREELEIQTIAKLEDHQKLTDSIVTFVKSDDCKTYLLQVLGAQIHSDRHKKFFCPTSSVRRQLKWESGFGPIEDAAKLHEVCVYLTHLCKNADIPQHFDVTSYVFEVWIPEAIIWALTKVLQISSKEAEEHFLKGMNEEVQKSVKSA